MPMHPLLPLIAIGLVFVFLILPIFLSYALRPKGNPAATVAADWPSAKGRIVTRIQEQLVSARYVSQRKFTGLKRPGQKVKVRGLRAEAEVWTHMRLG